MEVGFLFPTHQETAEAVEPAEGALDHPAAGAPTWSGLGAILAPAAQVQLVMTFVGLRSNRFKVVTLVQTQPDWFGVVCRGSKLFKRVGQKQVVVAIGARDHHRQRHARSLHRQADLRARLAPVGRIGPGFFPLPREPW